jgi:DNA-binding Lrp family transcriptional regulator
MPDELDEKDRAIERAIKANPRATVEQIAAEVGIPIPTAQKRVHRLMREDRLERILRVAGPKQRYRVDVFINARQLYKDNWVPKHPDLGLGPQEELALFIEDLFNKEPFKGKLICDDVAILLGDRADLSIRLRARNADNIREFVTGKDGLRNLPQIQNTPTAREVWSTAEFKRDHNGLAPTNAKNTATGHVKLTGSMLARSQSA